MMSGWPAAPQAPGISHQAAAAPASYTYPQNPAFTPVQVRQGFGQYIPTPPQPYATYATAAASASSSTTSNPPEKSGSKVEWPDAVRSYVQRAFLPENEDRSIPSTDVRNKLKDIIGSSKANGTMDTLDWANMPLPQQVLKAEREQQLKKNPYDLSGASLFNPKKRKSSDLTETEQTNPWRNGGAPLESRVTYSDEPRTKMSKSQKNAKKRQERFRDEYETMRSPSPPPPSSGPIVGTCEVLEKRYLRLTAPPVPSKVRPEHILRQTLDLLKKKWRKESNYAYICDQFKSMRQDLTVQRIKNDFTVSVYEIHARIALEKGDIGEYNQCQTQLRSLYSLGLKGNPMEFKAYRILYFIHTANRMGLNDTLADLTAAEKEERPIKHALNVRSSLALGNYHKFFQLYLDTPNMGAYLMDMFVSRERLAALCNICRSYKPDVKLRFITEELGFESDADAAQFIIDHKGQALLQDRTEHIAFLTGEARAIFDGARASAFQTVDIKGQI